MTRNKKHNKKHESSYEMMKGNKIRDDLNYDDDLSNLVRKEKRGRKMNKKELNLYQNEYGKEYHFYAKARASGILHLAYAYSGHDFDGEGNLIEFSTFCGRTIIEEFSPDFEKTWHISNIRPEHTRMCRGCEAGVRKGMVFRPGNPIEEETKDVVV